MSQASYLAWPDISSTGRAQENLNTTDARRRRLMEGAAAAIAMLLVAAGCSTSSPSSPSPASLAFSPDGQLLATSAGDVQSTDTSAQLWTVGGAKVAMLVGHRAPVTCLAWSPDGQLVASGSRDGSVRLWNRSGRLVRTLAGNDPVVSLAWSPVGAILAVGAIHFPGPSATGLATLPGVVSLWRPDGNLLHTLGTQLTGGKFLNLAWSPDGSLLAAGASDYYTWRPDGQQVGVPRLGGTPAWAMAWSPNSRSIAIGDESGGLDVVAPDGTVSAHASFASDINALRFSPDGAWLAVGQNGLVSFVRPADPASFVWSAIVTDQGAAVWSLGGSTVAIATADGLALFSAMGSPVAVFTGCPGTPTAFGWTESVIAATTDQGLVCAWLAPSP